MERIPELKDGEWQTKNQNNYFLHFVDIRLLSEPKFHILNPKNHKIQQTHLQFVKILDQDRKLWVGEEWN
ncbi:hypothetical protein L1987_34365 [Smallanthus sonchifolius]|uniref:Uncharacterized protein n=1 Tax=Smallanthus sonchifolius TaxID=185202 RepID=A0ACB9HV15_9ASTR|nr:hypothetical protein L1987_34365 [Smallanthus sonchifolius]